MWCHRNLVRTMFSSLPCKSHSNVTLTRQETGLIVVILINMLHKGDDYVCFFHIVGGIPDLEKLLKLTSL